MLPLFDNIKYIHVNAKNVIIPKVGCIEDFNVTLSFLRCYTGSLGTFNSYRSEVERLLQWAWNINRTTLSMIRREDIEQYILFCQKPPSSWIGLHKTPRYINLEGSRIPNENWYPFVVTLSKSKKVTMQEQGIAISKSDYNLSQSSIQESFAILSTFFNFLVAEEHIRSNPIVMIRQKSRYFKKHQSSPPVRRLTHIQWAAVLKSINHVNNKTIIWKERTRFLLSLFYGLYLRISEVTATDRYVPTMNCFVKDANDNWWFKTIGKGNKERQIAVSNSVLESLKRWRTFLGLSPLPSPSDTTPLVPKIRGYGPMTNTAPIRRIMQECFNKAFEMLDNSHPDEAHGLRDVTVHWLRHTGISEDVKTRPLNHVRDDAGHESIVTTNRYISSFNVERHESARNKTYIPKTLTLELSPESGDKAGDKKNSTPSSQKNTKKQIDLSYNV